MSLTLTPTADGQIDLTVRQSPRTSTDDPAWRMAVYLLAAARRPIDVDARLPAVSSAELVMLSRGRLVRHPIR